MNVSNLRELTLRRLLVTGMLLAVVGCPSDPDQQAALPEAGSTVSERPTRTKPRRATPPLNPEALELIDRLDEDGHQLSWRGDEVTAPESFSSLVLMGREALPTILHVAETTDEAWTRDLLIDIAGRIRDPGARPLLRRLLQAKTPNTVSESIGALARLGDAESIPALRQLLGDSTTSDSFRRLQIFEAIYRCGDESVLADVLAIGLAQEDQRDFACEILARHQPLRDALGFEGPYREGHWEWLDEEKFLPAAEEWYREEVLGEPSPWRAALEGEFSQPFLQEKRAAWAVLLRSCVDGNSDFSNIRATAVDPVLTPADAGRALTVISGYGHSHGLDVLAWRVEANGRVRGHRFELRDGPPRSAFPEDQADVS